MNTRTDLAKREAAASTKANGSRQMQSPPIDLYENADELLLLADMPGKWQDQFLRPGPWPDEFTSAMRETFLRAGPDFQVSKMTPRPLDLGPITTLTNLGRLPYFRMALVWTLLSLLFIFIFWLTHGGIDQVQARFLLFLDWFSQNG